MTKPKITGITGGIGGGKSTFANILRSMGYAVYDSDSAAKMLQNDSLEIRQQIVALFGEDVYTNGNLNRKLLADRAFNSPALLAELNKIVHPAIFADFEKWVEKHAVEDFLFVESALLFSSDLHKYTDFNIAVTAPESVRIQRIMNRDGLTLAQVRARIANQLPEEKNIAKADLVLYSDGKNNLTKEIVEKVIEKMVLL